MCRNGKARRRAGVVVWAGRKADDPAGVAAARAAMLDETEDEYRRLLYVAMTRAADRLIVGGCMPGNMNTVRECSWYDLIAKGLERFRIARCRNSRRRPARSSAIRGRRMPTAPAGRGCGQSGHDGADRAAVLAARRRPRRKPPADNLLRPSDPAENVAARLRTGESVAAARARACSAARWCTGCCNRLPELAAERRRDAAIGYLARNAEGLDRGTSATALAQLVLGADRGRPFRRRCSHPAAAPRSRSPDGWSGRDGPAGAGFRADRPAGGDAERGPDRRLQDQPRPAEAGGRGAAGLCPPARALPRGAGQSFIPSGRSAPRCFGPKPLN